MIGGGNSLIHAYAMARDMRAAVVCFEEMEAEGISPNAATVSVIISGYARLGNVEYVILPPVLTQFTYFRDVFEMTQLLC